MTLEQLLLLLLFVVIPLLNFLRRVRAQRRQAKVPAEVGRAPATEMEPAPLPPVVVRARPPEALPAAVVRSASTLRPDRRPRGRWPVEGVGAARRGIVLMMVLGPCRGLEDLESPPYAR